MTSMKAKKGNPFEYDVAYSLKEAGYSVTRIDDNSKGLDLIATTPDSVFSFAIECKNRQALSWNLLKKIFNKTATIAEENNLSVPIIIFHSNRQPVLVYMEDRLNNGIIHTFEGYFNTPFKKRPKGYKLWT